jgi:hypothetical protein
MAPMAVFLHTYLRRNKKQGGRSSQADLWSERSAPGRRFVSGMTEPFSYTSPTCVVSEGRFANVMNGLHKF